MVLERHTTMAGNCRCNEVAAGMLVNFQAADCSSDAAASIVPSNGHVVDKILRCDPDSDSFHIIWFSTRLR